LEVDIPRPLGFFGGIATAVALGFLEPPLAVFIAAEPYLKMLSDRRAPRPMRFFGLLCEGAAKPVGSSAQGTVRLSEQPDQ
jgi:hypothetical protein